MKRPSAKALFLAALAFALAFVVAGCGASGEDPTTSAGASPSSGKQAAAAAAQSKLTVSAGQVSRAPQGTAERTVLEWWREVQANDPEQALSLYLTPPTLANLAGQFNLVSSHLAGSVEVLSVAAEGDHSVAKVRWRAANGDVRVVTLRLQQDGAVWKLMDSRFLDEMVVELQAAGSDG